MSEQPLALRLRGSADRSVELPSSGGLVIGSSAERAGFVVAGADVAEVHCAIGRVKGKQGWAVRDLGSRAGTQLNARTVSSARLSAGDRLKLGSIELEVFDPQAQSAGSSREEPGTQRVEERSGPRVGGFRIERTLGRGSMGQVFLAVQENLDRRVALKVLPPQVAGDAEFLRRFQSEARAAAALNHPNVVVVYDFGESDGHPWLSMEYMEEGNLEERVAGAGALSWQEVTSILADAAAGLVFAEAQGILHRDIKPSNILVHRDGRAVIADFGLAKSEGDPALSLSGSPLGTPHYMSPEQALASEIVVDHRSDVYSLGVTFYEALSGRRPYEGESILEVLDAIRNSAPPALMNRDPAGTPDAAAVTRRAMSRSPEQRYASMEHFEADLRALAEGRGTQARGEQGGLLRRALGQLSLASSGYPYEYRSARTFAGLPLVHINVGPRRSGLRLRRARGWFALGQIASGGIAVGYVAFGLCALGAGASGGLLALGGGCSLGLLAAFAGGLALGGFATAGVAAGGMAIGGVALGYAAIGGFARGRYAVGGNVDGQHVLGPEVQDPEAEAFFGEWMPWVLEALGK